jgi:ATP-dependent RNA helicase DDX18/HAS1
VIFQSAKEGYKSCVRAYASHSLRNVFEVQTLDLKKVARSFGFDTPPWVGEYSEIKNFIIS